MDNQRSYELFLDLVARELKKERSLLGRQMKSVAFWCFIVPLVLGVSANLGIRFGFIPKSFKSWVDSVPLIFTLLYSMYFFFIEVLRDLPRAIKKGGVVNTMEEAKKEGLWRKRVSQLIKAELENPSRVRIKWVATSFDMDIQHFRSRNRFLTVFAGAVFFLITDGMDAFSPESGINLLLERPSFFTWLDMQAGTISHLLGAVFFLPLLYLSSAQTISGLKRYYNCLQLLLEEQE